MARRPRKSIGSPGDAEPASGEGRGSNTKRDIVRRIAKDIGLPQEIVHDIVQRTIDAILEAIVLDERVEFRNFGVFSVRRRAPRRCRNLATGEEFVTPARYTVKFKPGKELEARVSELGDREAAPGNPRKSPSPGEAPEAS